MKINFDEVEKRYITVADIPIVEKIINNFEAEKDVKTVDEAKKAAELISGTTNVEIIKARARITKNNRINNFYDDDTRDIDVWVDFTAYCGIKDEFYIAGAYLSDIWQICDDKKENDYIKVHMYIRTFSEK